MLKILFFPFVLIGWLVRGTITFAVFLLAVMFLLFVLGSIGYGWFLYDMGIFRL